MRLLILVGLGLVAIIAAKRKVERKKFESVDERMVDTTGVDWKDVDVKKG